MAEIHFGQLLKRARKDRGLSLYEAAKGIGLSFGYLGKLERETCPPPRRGVLAKLAEFYEIDLDALRAAAIRAALEWALLRLFCRYSHHSLAKLRPQGIKAKLSHEAICELVDGWGRSLPAGLQEVLRES